MEEVYKEKKNFVERTLQIAAMQADDQVSFLSYDWDNAGSELVTINYFGGNSVRINVSANSLAAILMEVARELSGGQAHGRIGGAE